MSHERVSEILLYDSKEYLKVLNGSHKTVKLIARMKYIRTMTASANM